MKLPNTNQGTSPKVTQSDENSKSVRFIDYTMRKLNEVDKKLSEKHDLSKSQNGYILYKRIVSASQASTRTSESFMNSISKDNKNKIWEFFVFVPEISDSISAPTTDQIDLYNQIKKADSDYASSNEEYEGSQKKLFDESFNDYEKTQFLQKMEQKLLSQIRFYGTAPTSPGNGIRECKVMFPDKNNLQYGRMIEIGKQFTVQSSLALKERIRKAKKDMKIEPESRKMKQKREQIDELIQNTGTSYAEASFSTRPMRLTSGDTSMFTQMSSEGEDR